MRALNKSKHSRYLLNLPIFWIPKYQCSILNGYQDEMKDILYSIVEKMQWDILAHEVMPDHVHLFVSVPHTVAPCDVAKTNKEQSGRHFLVQHPGLPGSRYDNSLCVPEYFETSARYVSIEAMKAYIEASTINRKGTVAMQVRMTYKYKLYNSKQNRHLDQAIDIAAEIWNHCIALHRRYYRMYGKFLSANQLKVFLTKLKKRNKYAHWNQLGSQAVQDIPERINRSYKAFFDHVKSGRSGRKAPPKFCKRKNYSSFTLKQAGYQFHGDNHVTIMGRTYKYVKHRSLIGTIKTVTVKRTKSGEFHLCVSVVQEAPDVQSRTGNAVGLDFGLKHFLTMDNGKTIDSPQWYLNSMNEIRKAHRKLSRCKKGSNNRRKALLRLEKIYQQISNRRRDWFFKLAHDLTAQYGIICIENIKLVGMKRLWGRKVSDLAFAEFVGILEWIAKKNGCCVVKVDRWFPSSKACHVCGTLNTELSLTDRKWICEGCGTILDRDINAAINIREGGLAIIAS